MKFLVLVAVFAVGVTAGAAAVVLLPPDDHELLGSCDLGEYTDCSPQEVDAFALTVLGKYYCPIDEHQAAEAAGGRVTAHSPGGRSIDIRFAPETNFGRTEVRVKVSGPKLDMCRDFASMILKDMLYVPRSPIAPAGK